MRVLDLYWKSHPEYIIKEPGYAPVLKENAPEDVKASYKRYLEQLASMPYADDDDEE